MVNRFWLQLLPLSSMCTSGFLERGINLATYQTLTPPTDDSYEKRNLAATRHETSGFWDRASTWGLMLPLLYFALDGVSPFVNGGTAMRAVMTSSAGGAILD